ncbi:MAG: hypothetical protein MI673_10270, partial [Thiotrichales bacterium]|nr:hypothetical protein [Thiotrichales bacterium]
EIMPIKKPVRELISAQVSHAELRDVALKQGMRDLKIGGAQKVADGLTTMEELYSVLQSRED